MDHRYTGALEVAVLGVGLDEFGFVLDLVEETGQVFEYTQDLERFFFIRLYSGLLLLLKFFELGDEFICVCTNVFLGHLDCFIQLVTFYSRPKQMDLVKKTFPERGAEQHVHKTIAFARPGHTNKDGGGREAGKILISHTWRHLT